MKTFFLDNKDLEIKEPNSYSSFHNDICFLLKRNKIANVYLVARVSSHKDVITVETDENHVLARPDNAVFLLSSSREYEPLLMNYGFTVDSYGISKSLSENRFALSLFLKENGINIPDFALSSILPIPFIAKEVRKMSYNKLNPIIEKDQVDSIMSDFFAQEWIGRKKLYQVDYRVYTFLGEVLATSIRFNKVKGSFAYETSSFLEIPLIDIPVLNLRVPRAKSKLYTTSLKWEKLSRSELLVVGEVFKQEKIPHDVRLRPISYSSNIEDLAKETVKVCRLGYAMVNIVTDEDGIPYVIDVDTSPDKEVLSKRLGVDRLASVAYLALEQGGYFNG